MLLLSFGERLRTLLILGRISNLPTVWSNLLAGWILVTNELPLASISLLLLGGSSLYVGGMYLNDFCDVDFDQRHCPERPILSNKISRTTVGILALLWFALGIICLTPFGIEAAICAFVLLAAIMLYDFRHKGIFWAPWLMGFCRFLLYPLAACSAATTHPRTYAPTSDLDVILGSLVLALYVVGITYLARGESRPGKPARWALVLLLLSAIFACLKFDSDFYSLSILLCTLQLIWFARLLIPLWRKTNPSIGRVVSGLLAGIVLVDMIAVAPVIGLSSFLLLPLFLLALLLQRFIPAT